MTDEPAITPRIKMSWPKYIEKVIEAVFSSDSEDKLVNPDDSDIEQYTMIQLLHKE